MSKFDKSFQCAEIQMVVKIKLLIISKYLVILVVHSDI